MIRGRQLDTCILYSALIISGLALNCLAFRPAVSMSQRTRSVTSMKCWRPVTGLLICGITIAPLSPAVAQAVGRTTNAYPVNSAYEQQIARVRAMVGGDTIAKFFLSLAADPAKSFIMNQIGLETTSS